MKVIAVVLMCLVAAQLVSAAPRPRPDWLDQLFGVPSPSRSYYGQQQQRPSNRQPRDRFKPICRVINADNYAFPGKVPYPSAPFCPYGD